MSKGFLWFCQNNENTDYVKLSIELAKSIKTFNKNNNVCVVDDKHSKFTSKYVDEVKILKEDSSEVHNIKWANEYRAFDVSPFTHTIKLEADMLWTANTDWWWYYLWQHDLVFSVNCFDYKKNVVKDTFYRKLFVRNYLPNIYNGLTYFRRSQQAKKFYDLCKNITLDWENVKKNILINCHDQYPSTDVVYALAYRIMDPTCKDLIDYPWFKFIHNKEMIQTPWVKNINQYLMPIKVEDKLIVGSQRLNSVWHYHDKTIPEKLNERIF
jgi:hypothetical protein